mgnify:CR=1 FL=1
MLDPDYIFETGWEVCNRVGGIYAVMSTKAATMQKEHKDKVFFIGPDIWLGKENPYFKETKSLLQDWQRKARKEGLRIRVGRWQIPGRPIAILVDFSAYWSIKDEIYSRAWESYRVNSLEAYGDYDESSLFAYASGVVIESIYKFYNMHQSKVVAHFNEWQCTFGLFYVKSHLPQVGTLFTTHATSIGRSIAGNNKPLYDYFTGYNGDQMAKELNMVSKHSTEKQAAHFADCFTTVSLVTDRECKQLLEKSADVVTPNGFENDFVPKSRTVFLQKRKDARQKLHSVAEQVLGYKLQDDVFYTCISGRYEWKNKGIDAYLHSLRRLAEKNLTRKVVAFVMVPAWQKGPYDNLGERCHFTTHQLVHPEGDPTLSTLNYLGIHNTEYEKVKVIFVPSYLNGDDGVFNMTYYDLLIGMDVTVFPSYYEPWGYTPLESVAFSVPTITTDLSGFGQWVESLNKHQTDSLFADMGTRDLSDGSGVYVVHRTDSNWSEMTTNIANQLFAYFSVPPKRRELSRLSAEHIASLANWEHFFEYYRRAYHFALSKHYNV